MNLRSLLMSSDDATVRILRRVLSDLEILVEHCAAPEHAVRNLTRHRFEAIIVDASNAHEARDVMRTAKASPANVRAVTIVLVEAELGLKGGFEMGAHFVLHKPLTRERARSSFRAVRALMKSERRRQVRVPVQIPVDCEAITNDAHYTARTLDLCEGGMAIQFSGRFAKDKALRFRLNLPSLGAASREIRLDMIGELAWDGGRDQAGVRFKDVTAEQRALLRQWLNSQLPEPVQDDPPVTCRLSDLTLGACYLETSSPFPVGTRVLLALKQDENPLRAGGIVRIMHPEFGMGIEFARQSEQREQVRQILETLRSSRETLAEMLVEPEGLDAPGATSQEPGAVSEPEAEDSLVEFFRQHAEVPVEAFLRQMRRQRKAAAAN